MRIIRHILTSFLLVIWILVGAQLFNMLYYKLGALLGSDSFHKLDKSLGSLNFHITHDFSVELLWFRMILAIVFMTLMTMPAVWLIRRGR